jgi:hypothetical protein
MIVPDATVFMCCYEGLSFDCGEEDGAGVRWSLVEILLQAVLHVRLGSASWEMM